MLTRCSVKGNAITIPEIAVSLTLWNMSTVLIIEGVCECSVAGRPDGWQVESSAVA